MDTDAHLGNARTYHLSGAICFYHEQKGGLGSGFATYHEASADGKRLLPGRPMDTAELRAALARIDQTPQGQPGATLLPPELLAYAPGILCWHRPARPATLWFSVTDKHGKIDRKHPLNKLSGGKFPMPALVWLARDRHLSVFACPDNARPGAKTPLRPGPFWNVSPRGGVCLGDMPMPASPTPAHIADIEKAFFQSNFTHPNMGKTHKGEHADLWRTARKHGFPTARLLRPIGTLQAILDGKKGE